MRVAVVWNRLADMPEQLQRIAASTGAEPVLWDGYSTAPDVEALIAEDLPVSVPRDTPHLRFVQLVSAGAEWLDQHPIWHSDIPVAVATGVHGVQIGEHVMMLLLALRHRLPAYFAAQRRHEWIGVAQERRGDEPYPDELYGLTMGLVGYGHIGRGIAHLARAFGMRVLATSYSTTERVQLTIPGVVPFVDPPAVPTPTHEPDLLLPLSQLDELLASSDAVVICAPLTPETANLIDAARLARMKPGAHLINIARGKIVEEDALVQALHDGRLAGAGLDVTQSEPLPPDSPLWDLPNVIITPHVSGRSDRYVERTVNILLANLDCLRRGKPPLTVVDRRRRY